VSVLGRAGLARGAGEGYGGPLWVSVHAGGGWDPTALCDPKGRKSEAEEAPVNRYFTDEIGQAGAFHYAPVPGHKAFFDKYKAQLTIINGIDTATNSHDAGTRNTWSGKLTEGYPGFSALVAAANAPTFPLAFLSNGGYDVTAGLVAPTRVGSPDVLTRLAWPERIDPQNPDETYHSAAAADRLALAREARLERLMGAQHLPRVSRSQSMLFASRLGGGELKALTEVLPAELDDSNNPLMRQAQLAIAAYKAGLTVSANLQLGGFDTHGNHDDTHYPRLAALLEGVDFLMEEADRQGVADQIVVVVGSDFGRTPYYNSGDGKDHWSITSMMFLGHGIPKGRLIGATDAAFKPLSVDPATLALDPGGIRITPEHVQRALRKLAGIEGAEVAERFPVDVESLPLFS
jgi:uncharacterized protein (DUF1501 family)